MEVVVATMVSAMMVTAFMSIALSAKVQSFRADHKLAAARHATKVLERLKAFTADAGTYGALPNGGVYPDDAGGQWALTEGVHTLVNSRAAIDSDPAMAGVDPTTLWVKYCVAKGGTTQSCLTPSPGMPSIPSLNCLTAPPGGYCVAVEVNWVENNPQ